MRFTKELAAAAWLCAALVLAVPAAAAGDGAAIGFEQAQQRMLATSGTVRASALDAQAQQLQAEAAHSLGGPSVDVTGFAARGSVSTSLDVSGLTGGVNRLLGGLSAAIPALRSVSLPSTIGGDSVGNVSATYLGAAYPVYTGGKFQALQGMMDARAEEAASAARETEERTTGLLVRRYFGAQLAHRVVEVRADATRGIAEHQHTAQRFEQEGQIAKVDRLRADVALAEAQRDESRARSDAELADVALARMIDAHGELHLATPLFVHSASVGTLQAFIDRALAQNPAFAQIAGKRHQADALHALDKAQYAPDVFAVGAYQLNHGGVDVINPNWAVGVVVNVRLVGQLDRAKMLSASALEQQRAEAAQHQAELDVTTLVEMHWRSLEQARLRYATYAPGIALAEEHVRLAEQGFREGQATSLDVVDARLALAKVRTERAQAAYDYDIALGQLLESTGAAGDFAQYAARADIRLEEEGF